MTKKFKVENAATPRQIKGENAATPKQAVPRQIEGENAAVPKQIMPRQALSQQIMPRQIVPKKIKGENAATPKQALTQQIMPRQIKGENAATPKQALSQQIMTQQIKVENAATPKQAMTQQIVPRQRLPKKNEVEALLRAEKIGKALVIISNGNSPRQACKEVGIAPSTFLKNVDADQYARARDSWADAQFEEMGELESKVLKDELDPQVFRVAMDSRKWRLARMRPELYGDRTRVDLSAEHTLKLKQVSVFHLPENGRSNDRSKISQPNADGSNIS